MNVGTKLLGLLNGKIITFLSIPFAGITPKTFFGVNKRMFLDRLIFSDYSTIGELFLDNKFFCFILEDTVRKNKIPGKTAIPSGSYEIERTYSPRFKKVLPILLNVPNFEGIRIHPGNTPQDTDGCLLPGMRYGKNCVYESVKAFTLLDAEIQERLKKGPLFIDIIGGRH